MSEDSYDVGYGKPPKHTRFQPGQSGNPGGRKTGSRRLKTDLTAVLKAQGAIKINGQPVKGTKQQLMLKSLAERAQLGDVRATKILLDLIVSVLGVEDRGRAVVKRLNANDELILQRFLDGVSDTENSPAGKVDAPPGTPDSEHTGDDVAGE